MFNFANFLMLLHFWKSLSLQVCQLLCLNDVAQLRKVWCCERSDEGKNKVGIRASDAYLFSEGHSAFPKAKQMFPGKVFGNNVFQNEASTIAFPSSSPKKFTATRFVAEKNATLNFKNEWNAERKKKVNTCKCNTNLCLQFSCFFFANKSSSVALLKSTYAHEKLKGKKKSTPF